MTLPERSRRAVFLGGKAHGAKLRSLADLPLAVRKGFDAKTPAIFDDAAWRSPRFETPGLHGQPHADLGAGAQTITARSTLISASCARACAKSCAACMRSIVSARTPKAFSKADRHLGR